MIYACKPEKLEIYINSGRKTMDQIQAETGCDVIINGGLFNGSFKPVCHLKANGTVYAADQWKYFGYGWHQGKADIRMTSEYSDLDNYICCVCLVYQGKKQDLLYPTEMGGVRQRSLIGLYPNGQMIFFGGENYSPEGLQNFCLQLGLDSALMLDGGGSTQCSFPNGAYRQTRVVQNFILAYLKSSNITCPYNEPTTLMYKGCKGEGVKWVQFMLNQHGYNLDIDGIFGGKTRAATVAFQLANMLAADGIIGELTRKKLRAYEKPNAEDIIQLPYKWNGTLSTRSRTGFIILHHAGVTTASPEAVHNYHQSLGWAGIGYNLFVRKNGQIYYGRPLDKVGAHTIGYNNKSVGICAEGNFEEEQMTEIQKAAVKKALKFAKSYYPNATVKMHRECDATACPGKYYPIGDIRG